MNHLVEKHKIEFLHPQPSSEALVVSQNLDKISTKTLLPPPNVISTDKLETQKILSKSGILVAKTKVIDSYDMIANVFEEYLKMEQVIKEILEDGKHLDTLVEGQKKMVDLYNSYNDGKATERIFNLITDSKYNN